MKTKPLRMSYNFNFPSVLSLANRCHAMMMTLEQNMTTHSIYKHLLPDGAVQHTHSSASFEEFWKTLPSWLELVVWSSLELQGYWAGHWWQNFKSQDFLKRSSVLLWTGKSLQDVSWNFPGCFKFVRRMLYNAHLSTGPMVVTQWSLIWQIPNKLLLSYKGSNPVF